MDVKIIGGGSKVFTLVDRETKETGRLERLAFSLLDSNAKRYAYAKKRLPNVDYIFSDIKSCAKKCSFTAEMLKSEGNNAFKLKQYEKARELFTLSAAYAVPDHLDSGGKNTLALAIANRSGALFYSEKYKESLIDIENALQVGYPEELMYKLYDRQGNCYKALKAYKAAETAYQQAAILLDKATVGEVKKCTIKSQIEKNLEFCVKNQAANVEVDLNVKGEVPKLSDEPSATHPSLSSACEVEYKPGKGRHIVATRDIKPGEVLLVEKPYTSIFVTNDLYKDCCHHCFYPCITLLPCRKCNKSKYCTPECRENAWDRYHKYECGLPIRDLIGEGGNGQLSVRIMLEAGLDRLLAFQQKQSFASDIEEDAKKLTGCNEEGKYLSTDYGAVHKLHTYDHTPNVGYLYGALSSVLLTKFMYKIGFFDKVAEEDKEAAMAFVGECIIPHLFPFGPQRHLIHHNEPSPEGSISKLTIGPSILPTHSLFNHSCDLETCETFFGNTIVVYALQPFKQGQEIHVNYRPEYTTLAKRERQRFLQGTYDFKCSCPPCEEDWPLYRSIPKKPTFKCSGCGAQLDKPKRDFVQCQNCKLAQNIKAKKKGLKSATKLLDVANQSNDAQVRMEYIAMVDKLLVQPYRDYALCKAELRDNLWVRGSFFIKQYKE